MATKMTTIAIPLKTTKSSKINSTMVKNITQSFNSIGKIKNMTGKIYSNYYLIINFLFIENTTIPLSNILIEKMNYQINQTQLLKSIVEENRAALKRLLSMASHAALNDDQTAINRGNFHIDDNNDGKQHISNMQHVNQSE